MNRWLPALLLISALIPGAVTTGNGRRDCDARQQRCPRCHHAYCVLHVEKEKEKKQGWDVECKPICIPRVRLPWQPCDGCLRASVRYVRALKKVEWECPSCKYVWEAKECPCHNGGVSAKASPADKEPLPGPQQEELQPELPDSIPQPPAAPDDAPRVTRAAPLDIPSWPGIPEPTAANTSLRGWFKALTARSAARR